MARQSIEQTAESLYRVREFHDWVGSNVLFPTVPDAIEYAAAMHKAMQGNAP